VGVTGRSSSDYTNETLTAVKSTCLSIAQILGDSITSDAVIVGGLVPTLLYQNIDPIAELGAHIGTVDIDLAMDLVVLDKDRYEDIASCLKSSGFSPDKNENGNVTRQRWRAQNGAQVDFLMPPVPPDTLGGKQQSLTSELAMFTMRGLDLALKNRVTVALAGNDLEGRNVERAVPVCSPEIFVVLKALAIAGRNKPKDAYDIHYVLANDPIGARALGASLQQYRPHDAVEAALRSLRRDYRDVDGRGPMDVCSFLGTGKDDTLAGPALAYMLDFLSGADEGAS
jgi:hypothetical protein